MGLGDCNKYCMKVSTRMTDFIYITVKIFLNNKIPISYLSVIIYNIVEMQKILMINRIPVSYLLLLCFVSLPIAKISAGFSVKSPPAGCRILERLQKIERLV